MERALPSNMALGFPKVPTKIAKVLTDQESDSFPLKKYKETFSVNQVSFVPDSEETPAVEISYGFRNLKLWDWGWWLEKVIARSVHSLTPIHF